MQHYLKGHSAGEASWRKSTNLFMFMIESVHLMLISFILMMESTHLLIGPFI